MSATVAEGTLTFPVSHEHVCYQNNMMLSLTLLNAAHPQELNLLFFWEKFLSLHPFSDLCYRNSTRQDRTEWKCRRVLRNKFFHAFHRMWQFLKERWDFGSVWHEICIYLMPSWSDLGLFCLTYGVIFGDSLIKGYLERSFKKGRKDQDLKKILRCGDLKGSW